MVAPVPEDLVHCPITEFFISRPIIAAIRTRNEWMDLVAPDLETEANFRSYVLETWSTLEENRINLSADILLTMCASITKASRTLFPSSPVLDEELALRELFIAVFLNVLKVCQNFPDIRQCADCIFNPD